MLGNGALQVSKARVSLANIIHANSQSPLVPNSNRCVGTTMLGMCEHVSFFRFAQRKRHFGLWCARTFHAVKHGRARFSVRRERLGAGWTRARENWFHHSNLLFRGNICQEEHDISKGRANIAVASLSGAFRIGTCRRPHLWQKRAVDPLLRLD